MAACCASSGVGKIIEVAQRGERDPDRLAAIALANLGP
jgi:hypothetical protein